MIKAHLSSRLLLDFKQSKLKNLDLDHTQLNLKRFLELKSEQLKKSDTNIHTSELLRRMRKISLALKSTMLIKALLNRHIMRS